MTDNEMLGQILETVINIETDIKGVNGRLDGIDIRLDKVEDRLDGIDIRLDKVEDRLDGIDIRLDKVEDRLDGIDIRLDKADNEFDKLNSMVSALKVGQIELRKELKEVNIKVSDTYNLALDAWGRSVENRNLIETVN